MIIQHQSKLEHSPRIVQYYSNASPNLTVSPTNRCTPVLFLQHITLCMFESRCVQVGKGDVKLQKYHALKKTGTSCALGYPMSLCAEVAIRVGRPA